MPRPRILKPGHTHATSQFKRGSGAIGRGQRQQLEVAGSLRYGYGSPPVLNSKARNDPNILDQRIAVCYDLEQQPGTDDPV